MGFKCPVCSTDFGQNKAAWKDHLTKEHAGTGAIMATAFTGICENRPEACVCLDEEGRCIDDQDEIEDLKFCQLRFKEAGQDFQEFCTSRLCCEKCPLFTGCPESCDGARKEGRNNE